MTTPERAEEIVWKEPILLPGDIILTAGQGFISRGIRRFSQRIGESRTKANHVGVVVEAGRGPHAVVVEALHTVKMHKLGDQYGGTGTLVSVWRPKRADLLVRQAIVSCAVRYVGRRYGYLKILLHWLDWLLLGAYVFRRLGRMDRYPICSWLVAQAYYEATGWTFGCSPGEAQPDDIWDFCEARPHLYECVRPLREVP